MEGIGTWGRSGDLFRSDDSFFVGSVDASYPSFSTNLLTPFGAPPPNANGVFSPNFTPAESAWSLTTGNTPISAWPGVFDRSQFRQPSLPVAAVQLIALPIQILSPGVHSAFDATLDFQQSALNSPLDDWNIDFNNFEGLAGSNGAIPYGDQLACNLAFQHHSSSTSLPSSPTSDTWSTPHSPGHVTPSLASSNDVSSPAPADQTKSKPSMGNSFSCRQCGKTYDDGAKLRRHVRYHRKEYGCPSAGCGRRFSTKADLKRHQRSIAHGGGKRFRCPRCQKAFGRKDNLQRHEEMVHKVDLLEERGCITLAS